MHSWVFLSFVVASLLSGQALGPGSQVQDFEIQDLNGKPQAFDALKGEVTVVTFIATRCPVSNAYNERMKALYNDYSAKGVKWVFINANQNEPVSEVAEHARQHAFPFPVYKDAGPAVADRFGAQVTPEAFVIDKGGTVRYHGPIDDSQIVEKVRVQRLRNALDSVLAGQTVETPEAKAFGCSIKRAK